MAHGVSIVESCLGFFITVVCCILDWHGPLFALMK